MDPSTSRALWIGGLALGALAVVGVTVAASSAAAAPGTTPGGTPSTGPTGGGTPGVNTAPRLPTPTTPVAQTQDLTQAQISALVSNSQNMLATISTGGKVPSLAYPLTQATADAGNASAPTFVQQLAIFQAWVNTQGGFQAQGASAAAQLNTNGVLDYATMGALLTVSVGQALHQ